MKNTPPPLKDYPIQTSEKIRYGDTDQQGHVNNVAFVTYLEVGRVEFLFTWEASSVVIPGSVLVIANLSIDFLAEIKWPGTVEIGTRIASVGRSSITLEQGLFQNDRCTAIAKSVIVLMNESTRKSQALSPSAIEYLSSLAKETAE